MTFGLVALAHAQGATVDPVTQVATATSTGWDLVQQFGPIWGGMLLLYGLAAQIVKAGFWQKFAGRRLAGTVALVGVFGAVLEAHFGSGSWAGVIVTMVGAIKMLISPDVQPDPTKTAPVVAKSTVASMLVGALLITGSLTVSCGPNTPGPVVPIVNATIDCTVDNGGQIAALLASLRPKPGQKLDWHQVYLQVKAAGTKVGGCVLAQLVQEYLTSATYASTDTYDATYDATAALEKFRAEEAHGATFHTKYGDL